KKSRKALAFTFLFALRVYWDSVNPVLISLPNAVCVNMGNKKSRKALAFTFLFALRVYWDSVNPILISSPKPVCANMGNKKSRKALAFTFLFALRVYKDSVNPVVPRNYLSSKTKFLSIIEAQVNFFPGQLPDHTHSLSAIHRNGPPLEC
ncbi:hypothetical protein, partial [Arenibacter palladensis]|uniref:hypothetical protein n=1 Tax=Arenibacter palladensis TaxID=237373 RepID=UPI0026E47D36